MNNQPSSSELYDLAIIGAGGAAHNILLALERRGCLRSMKVLVFEPDTQKHNDRTWCFWTDQTDEAYDLNHQVVSHQWSRISATPQTAKRPLTYRYVHIRSADLYLYTEELLESYKRVYKVAEKVTTLQEKPLEVVLHTSSDQEFRAKQVLDSRPPREALKDQTIVWQSFAGWRVKAPGANWSPKHAVLMDFEVPQMEGTQFMYFLPTSPDEALVELTRFAPDCISEKQAQPVLDRYLTQHNAQEYSIQEREVSRIPMTMRLAPSRSRRKSRIIPIGAAGGVVKPSTGYAFKNMARHAELIAEAVENEKPLPLYRQRLLYRFCDTLLLRILLEQPARGQMLFRSLFEHNELPHIFRFLDEQATVGEVLKIMRRMPWKPFMRALRRQIVVGKKP